MMIDNTDGFDQLSTNQVFKYVYFMVMFNLVLVEIQASLNYTRQVTFHSSTQKTKTV